jgi:hypothetical protein
MSLHVCHAMQPILFDSLLSVRIVHTLPSEGIGCVLSFRIRITRSVNFFALFFFSSADIFLNKNDDFTYNKMGRQRV